MSGTTSLTADATHDVLLGQAGNSPTGAITVGTVRDLTLANTGALQLGSLSVNRHLSLSATGRSPSRQPGTWAARPSSPALRAR